MAEIAAVLDRRGALEPGGPQFLLDVPMRPAQSLGGSKNDTARTSSAAYRWRTWSNHLELLPGTLCVRKLLRP